MLDLSDIMISGIPLEALAKAGIKNLDISPLGWIAKRKIEKNVKGSPFIALYSRKDAELMSYSVSIGHDVIKYIWKSAIKEITGVICKGEEISEAYLKISGIVSESRNNTPTELLQHHGWENTGQRVYWLEDPHRTRDIEYLKELVIKIEDALSRPEIIAIERRFKARLAPEFNAVREGDGSFSLTLDYHVEV